MGALKDKQLQLLQRHYDGETGFLSALKAKKVIGSNSEAKQFIAELEGLSKGLADLSTAEAPDKNKMWNGIQARIKQEEHAQLFLGERNFKKTSKKSSFKIFNVSPIYQAAGVATCAFLLGIVFRFNYSTTPETTNIAQTNIAQANLETKQIQEAPIQLAQQQLEVDWVKSDGRVKLIQSPDGRNNIIWVSNRNKPKRVVRKSLKQNGFEVVE